MEKDIFGSDIKTGEDGQALVAANGELVLTNGVETGLQDIRETIITPRGSLFYDIEFGSRIHDWIHEENTRINKIGFESEIRRILRSHPRVVTGTETCKTLRWDHEKIEAEAGWCWIGETHSTNMVLIMNKTDMEIIKEDVNPDPEII